MVKTKMIEYRLNGPASQERIRIRLMAALRENRFPQSILIDGPVGIGKKALAMEIAQALQCTNPSVRPCGNCFGCKMAADTGVTDNWVVPMEAKEASARNAADVSAGSSAKTIQDFKQAYIEEITKNPYQTDEVERFSFDGHGNGAGRFRCNRERFGQLHECKRNFHRQLEVLERDDVEPEGHRANQCGYL